MKQILTILLIFILAFGCKPVKKVQTINAAISKKDTAQTVIIKEVERVDSAAIIKDILSKVAKQKKDFTTFNAKLKIDYEGQETSQKVTGHLSISKDSAIFVTISAPIVGVVMKVFVTKDSIILINQLKKTVQNRSISYLQESTQIPFDFSTLQDVIVGNPIFISNNIISYKATNQEFLVFMTGKIFKHLLTLDNIDF